MIRILKYAIIHLYDRGGITLKKNLVICLLVACLLFISGCDKEIEKGNYKEGTYFSSVEFASYGKNYVTTAVVYVDKDGFIKSVFIDSTYVKNEVNTTKKVLGDDYAMKETSANMGNITGGAEWYEQIAVIEKKIIDEQGTNWVKWADDEKTKLDGISGATITADTYIKAIDAALAQAK